MENDRIQYIRQQAITVKELTKGFTIEQRERASNAFHTMEEFANYILELTANSPTTPK